MADLKNANYNKKTPASGLRSPADMRIVQLELTNACPKRCSNCTRLVAHQRKPFMADREQWEAMLRSMEGFGGMVGVIGGEPTIHPDFDWLIRRYREQIGGGHIYMQHFAPIENYAAFIKRLQSTDHKRGLWTSLGPGYYRHYELIHETFPYQCINDHSHPGLHQALLLSYKDLGISREEFERKRNNCWVQRLWSASATPWGTYFCEVAAAIDKLFYDGAHAWPLEPGWYRRTPSEFGDQLKLCDHCSACLDAPRRPAVDEVDDVSPSNHQLLVQLQSPAVKHNAIQVIDDVRNVPACNPSPSWYMEQPDGQGINDQLRVGPTNRSLFPRRLDMLTVCVGRAADQFQYTAPFNRQLFDRAVVVTVPEDGRTQQIAKDAGFEVVVSTRQHEGQAVFNKGALLNDGLKVLQPNDWLTLADCDMLLSPQLRTWVMEHILNPGALYYTTRYHARDAAARDRVIANWSNNRQLHFDCEPGDRRPWGYFQLFNVNAMVLKDKSVMMLEVFPTAGSVDHEFMLRWPPAHRQRIDTVDRVLSAVHISHGPGGGSWQAHQDSARQYWRLVSVTSTDRNWLKRPIEYPCWLRMMRVDTGESKIIKAAGPGALVMERTKQYNRFGLVVPGTNRVGWGHDVGADGGQGYFWDGEPCSQVQFDCYQLWAAEEQT